MSDKLLALCAQKLDMHWNWLTSCGLINQTSYALVIDESINTLSSFAKYQLGKIKEM